MSTNHVLSAAEFDRIAAEDALDRANMREHDLVATLETAISTLVTMLMLVVGPLWVTLDLLADGGYSSSFEEFWIVPVVLTTVALVPLGLSLRRERTGVQKALAALLLGSLVILLVRCPWL